MIDPNASRWSDPSTWPWFLYVWAAFALIGLIKPARAWLMNRRATSWPVTEGHIESVVVKEPSWSFTRRQVGLIATISYAYSIAGVTYAGKYMYTPATKDEAESLNELADATVNVHYSPDSPSSSALLGSDIDTALTKRLSTTAPIAASQADLLPDARKPLTLFFAMLSAVGLVVSLWVHIGALMRVRVAPEAFFWLLHIGIFVVWIPAVLTARRLVGDTNRKDFWKVVLKGSPMWMRYMVYGFFGYAVVNFLFFFLSTPATKTHNVDTPVKVWRGFSGHWMAFYSAAFAILYTAGAGNSAMRCPNGHQMTENASYCPSCGAFVGPQRLGS